jgi:hypothetical protein
MVCLYVHPYDPGTFLLTFLKQQLPDDIRDPAFDPVADKTINTQFSCMPGLDLLSPASGSYDQTSRAFPAKAPDHLSAFPVRLGGN